MSEVTAMREGAAAALAVLGVNTFAYVPGQIPLPAAVVGPPVVDYQGRFERGAFSYEFAVWLVVAHGSDRDAQADVDAYMSGDDDKSVQAAVAADKTLGGAVADCKVTRAEPVELTTPGGVVCLAVEFTLTALAKRRS